MTEETKASVKLSELNLRQLGQVHNLVVKQQEALVAQSQEIGREIDALRDQRAELARQIAQYAADLSALSALMGRRQAAGDGATLDEPSSTLGNILRLDAHAPGVTLEVKAG